MGVLNIVDALVRKPLFWAPLLLTASLLCLLAAATAKAVDAHPRKVELLLWWAGAGAGGAVCAWLRAREMAAISDAS